MKEPLISVIVPVYNVERFLPECIASILRQTVHELQIILIDDGSTDRSGAICDEYAAQDDRIVVVHQKNSGVSAARNAGLDLAVGKYVAFADSDDLIPVDAYQNLLQRIEPLALVLGKTQLVEEDGTTRVQKNSFEVMRVSRDEFLYDLFEEKRFPYLGYPVDKLFLREIIEQHSIRFDKKVRLNEDRLFVLTYSMYCSDVNFCDETVYFYRQRSSGVIQETRRNVTVTDSEMTVIDSFVEMQKICKEYSMELYYTCSRKAFESALDLLNRVSKHDCEKKKRITRFLWENSIIILKDPRYTLKERLKIVGHTVLGR